MMLRPAAPGTLIFDEFLGPVDYVDGPVGVDRGDIASVQVAVVIENLSGRVGSDDRVKLVG